MWKRVTSVKKITVTTASSDDNFACKQCAVTAQTEPADAAVLPADFFLSRMSPRTSEHLINSVLQGYMAEQCQQAALAAKEQAELYSISEEQVEALAAAIPEVNWYDLASQQKKSPPVGYPRLSEGVALRMSWPTPEIDWGLDDNSASS
jgi:hypothetical protein